MKKSFLQSLRARKAGEPGNRLGFVSDNISHMAAMLGGGDVKAGMAALAKHSDVGVDAISSAIQNGARQLTWFDADNANPDNVWLSRDGKVLCGGKAVPDKDGKAPELASGSIMDFDAVFTTARRDRDGDVLEPKGAIIDPKMPLLWQHMPFQPIGRMLQVNEHTEQKVAGRLMIANTALGNDAAVLVEAGCLRISHGFSPIEYNPLKDDQGKDLGGWRIAKYAMMEVSLVSIPSNVDAEITAFSRGKFTTPLFKSWGQFLSKNRKLIVRGGFEGTRRRKDTGAAPAASLNITLQLKGLAEALNKKAGKKDDGEDDSDVSDGGNGSEKDDDEDDSETESGAAEKGKLLGDLIESVGGLMADESLPKEARNRLGVVNGMLEDIQAEVGKQSDALAEAAKTYDIASMFSCMAALIEGCVKNLRGVSEEVQRIAGITDLPEGAAGTISDVADTAEGIVKAVETLSGTAAAGDADDGSEPGDSPDNPVDVDDDNDEDDSELEERAEDSELEERGEDGTEQPDTDDSDLEKAEDDSELDERAADDSETENGDESGKDHRTAFSEVSPRVKRLLKRLMAGEELTGDEMEVIQDSIDARRFV